MTLALRSRRSRRVVVAAVLLLTALLASALPSSLHGFGGAVVLALVVLDVLLVSATGRLAFTWRPLDERESALRDRAYRRGFRLLGAALAVALVLWIAESYISFALTAPSPGGPPEVELNNVLTGRGLVAILQLLVMTPTLMIAWTSPDEPADDRAQRRFPTPAIAIALLAVVATWLGVVTLAPEQVVGPGVNANSSSGDGPQGSTCRHVVAGRMVGSGFGATVGMRVEACWNGVVAYVWGDPSMPPPRSAATTAGLPAGAPAFVVNPDLPWLTSCGGDTVDDFATVSQTCIATTDAAGTLHYTVNAHISALPSGLARHDVTLSLVITRTGRVLVSP